MQDTVSGGDAVNAGALAGDRPGMNGPGTGRGPRGALWAAGSANDCPGTPGTSVGPEPGQMLEGSLS